MSSTVLNIASNVPVDKGFSSYYQYPPTPRYNLDHLITDIKTYLGESGGIASEDIDSDYLISLARKYVSDPADWIGYFYNDPSKPYTRNAIENINQKANIVRSLFSSSTRYDDNGRECCLLIRCSSSSSGTPVKAPASTTMPMRTAL